jgi:transposase-like protein
LDFAVFTQELFRFQAIREEARKMRRLGMRLRVIAETLGVSEKTVWKALTTTE